MSAPLFEPTGKPYRFALLFFIALMLFGSYFAYDSVAAIEDSLREAFHVERETIGALYSWYSVAAIFTVFLGGALTDRIGTRRASLLFASLVAAGAVIVALAPNVATLYLGRLVFGLGSESLVVVQSAILARWFKGKELALSFGISLAVSRLGTLFTFNTEALIAERAGYRTALWVAAGLCVASIGATLIYALMDRKAAPLLGLHDPGAGDKIVLADLRFFPKSYWYVTLLCVTFYSAIFPFAALATDLFADKWGLPRAEAAGLGFLEGVFYNLTHMFSTAQGTTSILIAASLFCATPAGWLVDRVGRRASLMMLGALLMIPAHLAMGLTHLPPSLSMIVLGASFVLVPAAMWPAIPLLVEKNRVGTAFGLTTMIQNAGLMAFPYLNGRLRDATHSYTASQVMFAGLGAVGLVFAVLLWREDRKAGHVLERPGIQV